MSVEENKGLGCVLMVLAVAMGIILIMLIVLQHDNERLKKQLQEREAAHADKYEVREQPAISPQTTKVYVCGQVWDNYYQCYVNRYVAMDSNLVDSRAIIGAIK